MTTATRWPVHTVHAHDTIVPADYRTKCPAYCRTCGVTVPDVDTYQDVTGLWHAIVTASSSRPWTADVDAAKPYAVAAIALELGTAAGRSYKSRVRVGLDRSPRWSQTLTYGDTVAVHFVQSLPFGQVPA